MHALLPEFESRLKMIYIDPPYNTGNTFIYRDRYGRTQGKKRGSNNLSDHLRMLSDYHSDWLNMMYPRLILARRFLTKNGLSLSPSTNTKCTT